LTAEKLLVSQRLREAAKSTAPDVPEACIPSRNDAKEPYSTNALAVGLPRAGLWGGLEADDPAERQPENLISLIEYEQAASGTFAWDDEFDEDEDATEDGYDEDGHGL
jgi:hypothetical protein